MHNAAFVGNDVFNNGNGVFTAFNGNGGWGQSDVNVLWEGNHIHGSGSTGSYLEHQLYLQSWGEVVQFNRIDDYNPTAYGSNLKSRGIQDIIRYNYLGDGAAREMDLVDVQDAPAYMSFEGFLSGGTSSVHALYPNDFYPADRLAAEQEAFNSHFVYGNIYKNSTSGVPIHFAYDHNGNETSRKGSLYWYNNTFYEALCAVCQGQKWTLFDGSAGGGNYYPQVEFQTVQVYNNVLWMEDPARPIFQWNNFVGFIANAGKNLVTANWGKDQLTGLVGDGFNGDANSVAYQNATNLALHINGFNSTNILPIASVPFDTNSFALSSPQPGAATLPSAICEMPTRFAYLPNLGYAVPRNPVVNMGALDTTSQIGSVINSVSALRRYNTRSSTCR